MRILFIGGDLRMNYAAEKLSETYSVERIGLGEFPYPEGKFDAIILPLPLCKNGTTVCAPLSEKPIEFDIIKDFSQKGTLIFAGGNSPKLSEICGNLSCGLINYFAEESLTLKNAALTAEAAAALLAQSTDGALLGSKTLITGYGRIAKLLAKRLCAFNSDVTVAARNKSQRASAKLEGFFAISPEKIGEIIGEYDFVINTVPAALFTQENFAAMRRTCVFAELASLPEEPARSFADKYYIKYIYAAGLPGKYSPKTAGEFIAETVCENLEERL